MSQHEILTLSAMTALLSVFALGILWWSGRGVNRVQRLITGTLPLFFVTMWIELLPEDTRWATLIPRHWPIISFVVVLIVGFVTRNRKLKTRRVIRALTIGATYGPIPPAYGVIRPVYLIPYSLWGESLSAIFWVFCISSVLIVALFVYSIEIVFYLRKRPE